MFHTDLTDDIRTQLEDCGVRWIVTSAENVGKVRHAIRGINGIKVRLVIFLGIDFVPHTQTYGVTHTGTWYRYGCQYFNLKRKCENVMRKYCNLKWKYCNLTKILYSTYFFLLIDLTYYLKLYLYV